MSATDTDRPPSDAAGPTVAEPRPKKYKVAGQIISTPVEVRSARMVGGTFTAPWTAAADLIDYSGLRPLKLAGTLALTSIFGVQYTDTDLGPYHEIALAVGVEPHDGARRSGGLTTFIHHLPVNQKFTSTAGRGIWGFPKWVCDIDYTESARHTDVTMHDEDETVLSMRVGHSPIPMPSNDLEMSCYSHRDGVLRQTPWTMHLQQVRSRPGGIEIAVGEHHRMARDLRALGFPKRAMLSQRVGHLSCEFGAARVVEP